jgi:hypothetical protein
LRIVCIVGFLASSVLLIASCMFDTAGAQIAGAALSIAIAVVTSGLWLDHSVTKRERETGPLPGQSLNRI